MTGLVIVGSMADQGGVVDYAADLVVGTRHLELESLTVLNKSATNYYLQLFNYGFAVGTARNITASVAATGALTLAGHLLRTGDAVTIGGALAAFGNGYVLVPPAGVTGYANTFYVYDTLAHALAGGATGLQLPGGDNTLGTVLLRTAADAPMIPEEIPLMGTGSAPSNIVSVLNERFTRGLYARIVTAVNGSTLGGSDAKFTPRYRYAHGI